MVRSMILASGHGKTSDNYESKRTRVYFPNFVVMKNFGFESKLPALPNSFRKNFRIFHPLDGYPQVGFSIGTEKPKFKDTDPPCRKFKFGIPAPVAIDCNLGNR